MSIDTTSYLNSIGTSSSSSSSSSSIDKDAFLKILVAQLKNQSYDSSMDTDQMVSQLTQYSMLEQLTNMNTSLTSMLSAMNTQSATSAAAYIGKSVSAVGSSLTVSDGAASSSSYTLSSDLTDLTAYLYDSSGSVVRTVSLGDKSSGTYSFQWDGRDSSGASVEDGTYSLAVAGKNSAGETVTASTVVSGVVSGVSVSSGTVMLTLADGREVSLANIQSVANTDA